MRMSPVLCVLLSLCLIATCPAAVAQARSTTPASGPTSPLAPIMQNLNMECANGGFVPQAGINGLMPQGWTAIVLNGQPDINSARTYFQGSYCATGWVEHLEGDDALVMAAQDLETNPPPGKPFDALVYQQVAVTSGQTYSLSAWMVSFCGGSFNAPNDCPSGYYIAKMLGLDPSGGTDPKASRVIWTEDRQNFNQSRWVNLRLGVTAQSITMTVFARIRSPFLHHGNFGLIDAVSLMAAPSAGFDALPAQVNGRPAPITWNGALGTDIPAIPLGTYHLHFEVQSRLGLAGAWQDWLPDTEAVSAQFTSDIATATYYFRVRALAEQQPKGTGAWPNHRYIGEWTPPAAVNFNMHPPLAVDDNVTTLENTPVQIAVLANDSDPDPGATLSITSIGPAQHGCVSNRGQLATYSPQLDFSGSDVFTYTITDGGRISAPATVRVTVTHVDQPPRVRNAGGRMNTAGETVWSNLGVYDPEGEPVTITITGTLPPGLVLDEVSGVIHGTLAANALGTYPVTILAADAEQHSPPAPLVWRVVEHVWQTDMPVLARPQCP
jgi:Bacterial Ig domain/Putative Ig domain